MRSAHDPWSAGLPPHLPVPRELLGALPSVCLLPGDPGRVDLCDKVLSDFAVVGSRREYRLGIGTFKGARIAVCSTGIGGPSTEIAVVELARLGVRVVLRVGGMGALSGRIAVGTVCAVASAVLGGGAARPYVQALGCVDAVPTSAGIRRALHDAAWGLSVELPEITVASADSYYLGEGRSVGGYDDTARRCLADLERRGVDGVDMETETVLTVGRAMGLEAGALLVAHADRRSDEWLEDYEPAQVTMLTLASAAGAQLTAEVPR